MTTLKNTIAERTNKPEECLILPSFIVEGELCLQGLFKNFGILQRCSIQVFLTGNDILGVDRPFHSDSLIVPTDTGFSLRSIDIVHLISENSLIAQYEEAVSKAAGNEELTLVLVAQLYCHMLTKGGELLRISTATSSTRPLMTRTSLACDHSPFW